MNLFLFENKHGFSWIQSALIFLLLAPGLYDYHPISNVDQSSVPKLWTEQWSKFYWSRRLQCVLWLFHLVRCLWIAKFAQTAIYFFMYSTPEKQPLIARSSTILYYYVSLLKTLIVYAPGRGGGNSKIFFCSATVRRGIEKHHSSLRYVQYNKRCIFDHSLWCSMLMSSFLLLLREFLLRSRHRPLDQVISTWFD